MADPSSEHERDAADLLLRAHAAASPSDADRARIRARLSSAVAIGVAGTAGAVATKKGLGLLGGLASLPLFAKVGLSALVVGVAASAVVLKSEHGKSTFTSVHPVPSSGAAQFAGPATTSTHAVAASATPAVPAQTAESSVAAAPAVPLQGATAPTTRGLTNVPTPPATHNSLSAPPASEPHATASVAHTGASASASATTHTASSAEPGRDPNEVALLGRMSQSLGRGDASTTLALVAEHERSYPKSVFSEEREGARTVARCMTTSDARARQTTGETFLGRFPHSPMRARVLATCGAKNESP